MDRLSGSSVTVDGMVSREHDAHIDNDTDTDHETATDELGEQGQLSEVNRMDPADADTPISDDQSVAGSPSGESGRTDEGPTGPNSRGGADRN